MVMTGNEGGRGSNVEGGGGSIINYLPLEVGRGTYTPQAGCSFISISPVVIFYAYNVAYSGKE